MDAPEGNCAVTIILKHHGQWKALTKAFPTELGVSMFLDCYEQGCLYQDFNGWYDATDNFQNSGQDVRNSAEAYQGDGELLAVVGTDIGDLGRIGHLQTGGVVLPHHAEVASRPFC